jgi:hypothetical protein
MLQGRGPHHADGPDTIYDRLQRRAAEVVGIVNPWAKLAFAKTAPRPRGREINDLMTPAEPSRSMLVSRRIVRIGRLGLPRALKQALGRANPEKNADHRADREIEHSRIEHCPKSVTHSQPCPSSGARFDQMSAPVAGCRGHPLDHATIADCCRTIATAWQIRGARDAANAASPQAGFTCVITHQHRNGLQRVRYPRGQYRNHPRHTAS